MIKQFTVTAEDLAAARVLERGKLTSCTCVLAKCFLRHGLKKVAVLYKIEPNTTNYFLNAGGKKIGFIPQEAAELASLFDSCAYHRIEEKLPLTFSMEVPEMTVQEKVSTT